MSMPIEYKRYHEDLSRLASERNGFRTQITRARFHRPPPSWGEHPIAPVTISPALYLDGKWDVPATERAPPTESPPMKHNKNHDNAPNPSAQLVPVRFEYSHPTAISVCIAGTFNHWQPETKSLHPSGTGRWWKETALAPGTYEYCLVVDGHWMPDPLAGESVPNPFGGRNSILKVACSPAAAHLAAAEHSPLKNSNT
jgi:Glycogen recognition site of AMP-activated protein kinase